MRRQFFLYFILSIIIINSANSVGLNSVALDSVNFVDQSTTFEDINGNFSPDTVNFTIQVEITEVTSFFISLYVYDNADNTTKLYSDGIYDQVDSAQTYTHSFLMDGWELEGSEVADLLVFYMLDYATNISISVVSIPNDFEILFPLTFDSLGDVEMLDSDSDGMIEELLFQLKFNNIANEMKIVKIKIQISIIENDDSVETQSWWDVETYIDINPADDGTSIIDQRILMSQFSDFRSNLQYYSFDPKSIVFTITSMTIYDISYNTMQTYNPDIILSGEYNLPDIDFLPRIEFTGREYRWLDTTGDGEIDHYMFIANISINEVIDLIYFLGVTFSSETDYKTYTIQENYTASVVQNTSIIHIVPISKIVGSAPTTPFYISGHASFRNGEIFVSGSGSAWDEDQIWDDLTVHQYTFPTDETTETGITETTTSIPSENTSVPSDTSTANFDLIWFVPVLIMPLVRKRKQ